MSDFYFVTPLGFKLIKEYEEQLSKEVAEKSQDLGDLIRADPGDGPHDGMFIQAKLGVEMLQRQLQELRHTISTVKIVEKPKNSENISIGNILTIELKYPNGEQELLKLLVLGKNETNVLKTFLKQDIEFVSVESVLGIAVINKKEGDRFYYKVGNIEIKGKIIKSEVMDKLFII